LILFKNTKKKFQSLLKMASRRGKSLENDGLRSASYEKQKLIQITKTFEI